MAPPPPPPPPPPGACEAPAADAGTAQAVLGELQRRYLKWRQRNVNYGRLLAFVSFIVLLLAVLFLQRSSHTSFEVHSTLAAGLLPPGPIASVDDVYAWLRGLLQAVWRDPVCGDGVCEAPFEYAQYGRFGCRADCGRLQDIQNLTAIQLDLQWDFSHPAGSIPATELMSTASWNLCPEGDSAGCYYAADQAFDQLAGSTRVVVPDVPDGLWALVVKRDIFGKVGGAVRAAPLLERQAQAAKVAAALGAAAAARASEHAALQAAVQLGSVAGLELVNASLVRRHEEDVEAAAAALDSGALGAATYLAELEALAQQLEEDQAGLVAAAAACPGLPFYSPDPAVPPTAPEICERAGNQTLAAQQEQMEGVAALVLGRLAPAAATSDAALTAALDRLRMGSPELHAVVAASFGKNVSQPAAASAATLAAFYEDPLPTPAKAALSGRSIAASGMTAAMLVARCEARLAEIEAAASAAAARPEVVEAAALTAPGGALPYNYSAWDGGARSYTSCNLRSRTPQYVGTCVPRVACSNSSVPDGGGRVQVAYSCAAPGVPSPSPACGDLCDSQNICAALCECEASCGAAQECQCDACLRVGSARADPDFLAMQQAAGLAAALAGDPLPGEEGGQVESLTPEDGWQVPGEAAAEAAGSSSSSDSSGGGGGTSPGGRRLHQSGDAMLSAVLSAVGALQDSQAALEQQVTALQAAVQDAAAAARDAGVATLIATGQQQIVAGQAAIQGMLSEILGKQTAAAAAAAAQMQALANLQSLQQQQLAAQAALEQSAKDQAQAIAIALQQDMLTSSQALELYRRVRLQTLAATKAALLASLPCTDATLEEHAFEVDQYQEVVIDTSRVRRIGTNNRVIAGLLLFNQRGLPSACHNSRFAAIAGSCKHGLDDAPYGVDPVFKLGTSLYNPDLDTPAAVAAAYNCSTLAAPTYDITQPGSAGLAAPQVTNPPPYCAELFSPRQLPYGFHAASLARYGAGFPLLFDINLDAGAALRWLDFVQEGLYLDSRTSRLLAQLVAYNPDLRLFSSALVELSFGRGGAVQVSSRIQTLRVELYATRLDAFRLVLELALSLCVAVMALGELRTMARVARLTGNPLSYFLASGWRAADFASTCLLVACVSMWWALVWREALPFAIAPRFDVYADLGADAAYLSLAGGGAGLQAMHTAFSKLQSLSDKLGWYAALTAINLLLLIARMLQLMDFQPRLGVVTRSLAHAGPDLLHFGLVFGLVFVGYAMLAHLIFGSSVAGFSTFGGSVNTCFALLLGDTAVNADLQALSGLQGVAGAAFFWTFEVLVFLVLLNFLLAIIVDAFGQVKERTTDTTGLHTEVAQMLRHAYHSATSRFRRDRIGDAELARLLRWWQHTERSAADVNGDGLVDADEAALRDKARPKLLRVQGRAVTEGDLRAILQAYVVEGLQEGEDDIEAAAARRQPAGGGCLLGPLGLRLKRDASPSRRPIKPDLPDLAKVAHYVMQRFGEEEAPPGQEQGSREPSEGGTAQHQQQAQQAPQSQQQQQQQQPSSASRAAPAPLLQHGSGDFLIGAHRAADVAGGSGSSGPLGAAASAGLPPRRPLKTAELFGGEASNGRRLAHAMQTEAEQRGAADAGATLLQVQGSLADAQQRLLDSQRQLMAQHASVLQAVGTAAGGLQPAAPSGSGAADTGWSAAALLPAVSVRQRSMVRSDSGRAAALPPGRAVGAISARGLRLRLSDTSEEER